jgi:hypothetical protein
MVWVTYDPVTLIVRKSGRCPGGMAVISSAELEVLNDEGYRRVGIGLDPKARLGATNLEDLGG